MTTRLTCFLAFLCAVPVSAAVSLPKFFTDNMVLQRGAEVSVWGWAEPREAVTVAFGGQTKHARADARGNWMVRLDPMPASHEGRTLAVNDSRRLENVLVGDVWLCSGQSNMEWTLRGALNAKDEIAAAAYPSIRHIKIERQGGDVPRRDVRQVKGWDACQPDKAGEFTAVGYFFARKLHEVQKVPIGIVNSSWGGTVVEPWTAPEGFYQVPELAAIAARIKAADPSTDEGKQAYLKALEDAYGMDIVPSGPLFERISIQGDRIHVHFKHVGSGLMVGRKEGLEPAREMAGGQLKEFAIAGEDKVWHWAEAVIQGDKVVVSNKDVSKPVAVRYAYRMNPSQANLYNKEGLPASPFRSDNW